MMPFIQPAIRILCCLGLLAAAFPAGAEMEGSHSQHEKKPAAAAAPSATDIKLLDLEVLDQNGKPYKFRSEVIRDRLVVINFIYTTCKTACPIQSVIFTHLQEALGGRMGKDVFLVSITIDPATDLPARMKAYAEKHNAGEGWLWITGKKGNVDRVVLGLGAYSSDIVEHPSLILVGDGRLGGWTRYYGFPKVEQLLQKVDELQSLKNQTAG